MSNPKRRPRREWKLVPAEWYQKLSDEEKEELDQEEVMAAIESLLSLAPKEQRFLYGLGAIDEFNDYFPGNNLVKPPGAWILLKKELPLLFTPPPLSIWFATPWPMKGRLEHTIHRVKIITLKGEMGVFPHEYSRIEDISKYYEFIGNDVDIKFFGGVKGVPADALFYLRSRGISKGTAISMLLGLIKASEVCWLEVSRPIVESLGMQWPDESRLATKIEDIKNEKTETQCAGVGQGKAGDNKAPKKRGHGKLDRSRR